MDSKELSMPAQTALSQAMTAQEVVSQVKLIQDVMASVMHDKEHYGIVPGTKKKSLWKSGAEKLCLVFRLAPRFESEERYDGQHLTVKSRCVLIHSPSNREVGAGEAICTTKEKKYAYRKDGNRVVENLELPDLYNTIIKMANKRALVAATLTATAASDIFTQDLGEDVYVVEDEPKKTEAAIKTPAEIVKQAEDKHSEANANGYQPEQQKQESAKDDGFMTVILKDLEEYKLATGKAAWKVTSESGNEYATSAKECADSIREAISEGKPILLKYEVNKKGTKVISAMKEAKV